MVTPTTLLSDRWNVDFNSGSISFYAKDLNFREYTLKLLKKARLIKSDSPVTDVDNPENIFKIVFNAKSKLNVTMALRLRQRHVMYNIKSLFIKAGITG